jgi:hypothetical protein
MDTQPRAQPTSKPFPSSLPASMTGPLDKRDEEPARTDEKDEANSGERDIYDNVACTD